MQLLSSLDLRRDQANVVDASAAHGIDRASDICKLNGIIAFDEGRFPRALLEVLSPKRGPSPSQETVSCQETVS